MLTLKCLSPAPDAVRRNVAAAICTPAFAGYVYPCRKFHLTRQQRNLGLCFPRSGGAAKTSSSFTPAARLESVGCARATVREKPELVKIMARAAAKHEEKSFAGTAFFKTIAQAIAFPAQAEASGLCEQAGGGMPVPCGALPFTLPMPKPPA